MQENKLFIQEVQDGTGRTWFEVSSKYGKLYDNGFVWWFACSDRYVWGWGSPLDPTPHSDTARFKTHAVALQIGTKAIKRAIQIREKMIHSVKAEHEYTISDK